MKSYKQKKQSLRQNLDKLVKDRRNPRKIAGMMLFLLAIKGKTCCLENTTVDERSYR